MNVLVSTDNGYAFQTCVMLKSLFANHAQIAAPIEVYVLLRNVKEYNKIKIDALIHNCGHSSHLIEIHDEDYAQIAADLYFDDIKKTHHLTMAAYNRLLVTIKIPKNIDKILYLDSDIIVDKPLYDLYNLLESEAAVVVPGFTFKEKDFILLANNSIEKTKEIVKHAETFKKTNGILNDVPYFNSGVMVLNLKWLRDNNFVNMVKQHIKTHKSTEDADQSILNAVLKKKVSYTSIIYNCRPSDFGKNNKAFLKRQAYILHYGVKPWKNLRTPMCMKWWKYAFRTDYKTALNLLVKCLIKK